MRSGDRITVEYVETAYNTYKKNIKREEGIFIKEYKNYIQFYDKYKIRKSIMKQDLINMQKV